MAIKYTDIDNQATVFFSTDSAYDKENNTTADKILQKIIADKKTEIFITTKENEPYSSLLAAEIFAFAKEATKENINLNFSKLPDNIEKILKLSLNVKNTPPAEILTKKTILENIGENGYNAYLAFRKSIKFIAEAFNAIKRFITRKAIWRKQDFWLIFADCSYKAVGIVGLVSFLVGLILAFVGAMQLKTFGAEIYVASMVTMGMTRIMAAIMIGIIMAGRTGSSFAATIGTMQVNEEIDALKTLGVKISDYLVAPRIIALVTTIPFLTLLADILGILGGAIVGICFLDISSTTYYEYTINALDITNVLVGLLHSIIYGIIISLCGCYAGLNAGRNADSVGIATTSAVVKSLVWMIIATGILTVILEELQI